MQATGRSSADWRIIAFDGEVIVSTWAPFYGKSSLRRLLEELLHFTSDSRFDIVSETCSKSFCIHVHSRFEDSLNNIVTFPVCVVRSFIIDVVVVVAYRLLASLFVMYYHLVSVVCNCASLLYDCFVVMQLSVCLCASMRSLSHCRSQETTASRKWKGKFQAKGANLATKHLHLSFDMTYKCAYALNKYSWLLLLKQCSQGLQSKACYTFSWQFRHHHNLTCVIGNITNKIV